MTMPSYKQNNKFNLSGLFRARGGFRRGVGVLLAVSFTHSLLLSGGHGTFTDDSNAVSAVMSTGVGSEA